jgi:hypothetical protein
MVKILGKYSAVACSLMLVMMAQYCSSTPKKEPVVVKPPEPVVAPMPEPELKSRAVDDEAIIATANQKLSEVPMLALPAFKATYRKANFKKYAEKTFSVAQAVAADLPEGYVMEITGHSNPYPPSSKSKSNRLSKKRAKLVYDYFVENGIEPSKLRYRGVGSTQPDEELSHDQNRRVTFKIIKRKGEDQ